jgi:hypothetical protein
MIVTKKNHFYIFIKNCKVLKKLFHQLNFYKSIKIKYK